MSKYGLSSKKLVESLGIVKIFENLIKEINKRNPQGDFLLIRNRLLGLPIESKKQFFFPTKFVLTESSSENEYLVSIGSKFLEKSSFSVQCSCSCYFLDCYNLSFRTYQGSMNMGIGICIPCKDTYEEMTETIINFILNRPITGKR